MRTAKTGIVMMNLGGPANLDEVEPFLLELFADREIIQLPFQGWLGPFIARRRAPSHTMGIATIEHKRVTFELLTLD